MPRIKTNRKDILRNKELDDTLDKLKDYDILQGEYKTNLYGKPIVQTFTVNCRQIECLLALLWLFGKRITENLRLKRKDAYVREGYLYVYFTVLKKKKVGKRGEPGWLETVRKRYLKRIILKNPYVPYVLQYVDEISDPNAYLFPSKRSKSGHLSRNHAYRIVKFLNPKLWLHLFRESLATTYAEQGATEEELMHWFDWDRYETAHDYVKRGTKLTEKWSNRTF